VNIPEAKMITGIVMILTGILLVIYPPLLSIVVAVFMIFAGAVVISIAYHERRLQRHYSNPTIEFFFRH
jgi:UPF0716 family protein affecting phage T7 exclusion